MCLSEPGVTQAMSDQPPRSDPGPLALVVEDEALISLALEDDLTTAGYAVAGPFPTCAEGLAWLRTTSPHLAILDTVLRDGPCIDLARELRARAVPFVIYSGRSSRHNDAPELEGAPWVEKPAPISSVLDAIAEVLQRG